MRYRDRLVVVFVLASLGLAAVWLRAAQLQVVQRARWTREAEARRRPAVRIEAARGSILDARGRALAMDVPVVRLGFVGAEWETRVRWRCRACGDVHFRRDATTAHVPGTRRRDALAPTSCACGTRPAEFDRLPDEDVAPLEESLGVPRGTLLVAAANESRRLEAAVETRLEHLLGGVGAREEGGYEDALRATLRPDHFARVRPLVRIPVEGADDAVVKDLPDAAIRLLETDRVGRYRGFRAVGASERVYPEGDRVAQLVGYTLPITAEEWRARSAAEEVALPFDARVGRAGLERAYEGALQGSPGRARVARDADGTVTTEVEVEARPGRDVVLGLDLDACAEMERLLEKYGTSAGYAADGPPSGGFVAIDADDGTVVGWGETPRFDPNGDLAVLLASPPPTSSPPGASAGLEGPLPPIRSVLPVAYSRVASVAVEPGSCAKVLTALSLLDAGLALPETFHCSGPSTGRTDRPGCHYHSGHPTLDVVSALGCSCNRYFAALMRLPSAGELLGAFSQRVGIGRSPGVDFFPAAEGAYSPEHVDISLSQVAIGQSMTATPLQMVRVVALVANGDHLPVPRLAVEVGGVRPAAEPERIAVSPAALDLVRAGMRAAVTDPAGGTATAAFESVLRVPGLEVRGKTGTADVPNGRDFDPRALSRGPWHHWFIGYARAPGRRTIAFAVVLHARTEEAAAHTCARAAAEFVRWWATR